MTHLEVNGQSIFYTDQGDPAGPVVLATHATLMDSVSLEKLTEPIAAAGFRVITFDTTRSFVPSSQSPCGTLPNGNASG